MLFRNWIKNLATKASPGAADRIYWYDNTANASKAQTKAQLDADLATKLTPRPSSDGTVGQALAIKSLSPLVSEWKTISGGGGGGGDMLKADNLSGLADTAVARTNLGLGTVSQVDAEAGTSTTVASWTPERVAQAIEALGPGALGTAATKDITDFASAPDTIVACVWNGTAWKTASGGTVPTTSTILREYHSLNAPAATAPTYYNVNDKWHKALS